jgi:predicted transcriptional regulator
MNTPQTIHKEVNRYIDKADETTTKSAHALLVEKETSDWMDELPTNTINEIDKALNDLDAGKGIPHAEIAKKYPQWFTK